MAFEVATSHHQIGQRTRGRRWPRGRLRGLRLGLLGRSSGPRYANPGHAVQRVAQPVVRTGGRCSRSLRDRGGTRGRRLGHHVCIEPQLGLAALNQIAAREQALSLDPGPVHERAVRAAVHDDVSLGRREHLCVAPRDVLARHHDIAARVTADRHGVAGDRVLPPIRERHEAAAGGRRGGRLGRGLRSLRHHTRIHRLHVLRAAAAALVHEQQLLSGDLDFVAVQQGVRIRTQPHAVHADLDVLGGQPNGHLAVRQALHDRVAGGNAVTAQHDLRRRVGAYDHVTYGDGVAMTADLKVRHPKVPSGLETSEQSYLPNSGRATQSSRTGSAPSSSASSGRSSASLSQRQKTIEPTPTVR